MQPARIKGQKNLPQRSSWPFARWLMPVLGVLLLAWVAFFNHLGSTGLLDETEPLFAEAARQMTVTGDWITPYYNGVTRFDKPPLIYWLMAIAYQTIGTTAFAARLPSALAGTALVGFCWYALHGLGDRHQKGEDTSAAGQPISRPSTPPPLHPIALPDIPETLDRPAGHSRNTLFPAPGSRLPLLAAAFCALNVQILFFGRTGYSDMLLNLCFGGSLLAFWRGYCQPDRPQIQVRWYWAMYCLMALGVLTKGPVGIVLPGGIILLFWLSVGKLGQGLRELRVIRGGLLFLAIAVPWYVLIWLHNGEAFVDAFFGTHNIERFTNVVNDHRGPWYYHWVILAVGFLPWSVYLPAAIGQVIRQKPWQQADRAKQLGWFALVWFLVVMGFFTLAVTKYFSYSLPAVLAGAILVALWWRSQTDRSQHQNPSWPLRVSVYASLLLSLGLAAAAFYSPNWLMQDPTMPTLGARLRQSGLEMIGGGIWLAIAGAGTLLLIMRQLRWFWAVQIVGFAAFILFFITPALGLVDLERQLPLRQIAQTINQVRRPQEAVLMASNQFEKPSLVFYTGQPVTFFDRPHKAKSTLEQLAQTADTQTALMVVTPDALDELKAQRYQTIRTVGIYQLIRIPLKGAL
jgi:4-amino-4-deoxy-L-arabinose transferase-like glycosyltransferase